MPERFPEPSKEVFNKISLPIGRSIEELGHLSVGFRRDNNLRPLFANECSYPVRIIGFVG